MHRVLSIATDYAFCLHSKERVPYHIVIKVALDEDKGRNRSDSFDNSLCKSYGDENSSSSSSE